MKKNYISRRRGTSIAAAALSFALVTPFAQAVAPASPYAAVANAQQDQPAAEAPASGSDKAIHSPGQANQEGTISGSVKEIVEAKVGFGNVQESGKALKGVKIYAQWYEGENTQHSSPVYYTESDENGNFTIKMAPYTDALGVTREFRADASVGTPNGGDWSWDENREKIRVWTELPEDLTDTYRLVHQPAAGIFPGIGADTTPTTQGDGVWGDNKITGMTIQYAQKDKLPQHLPENKWAESTGTGGNGGTYAGRAFWNLDVLQGAMNHNTVSTFGGKDIPASGLKVVGSYLTDDAVNKIEAYAKDNFAGKTLRGKGWTPADEQGLQKWINEQVAADPEAWIAETLTTTTGANGKFELRWKGIYGNSHKNRGIVSGDKFGKLAGSHSEGAWENGGLDSKHVNMHWSYVSIVDKDGNPLPDNIGTLYPWSLGQWAGPGFGADLNAGANAQLFGGDGALIGNTTDGYTGWNIALVPQALKFDVVDKNTTDNWATIGEKVTTDTSGLPISDDLNYYIEWVDKNGKVVKTCATAKADSATKIPECELDVPTDAQTGDTFTARLKAADGDPDPKNDLVLAQDAFAVTREYLDYDEVAAKDGEEATSEPIFDNPETEDVEDKPKNATFELGELPEGVTEDQVKVDPATGVVTFTPNAKQAGKTITFPVVMRNEDLQVPVLDENGDQKVDADGKPVTQGRIVTRGEAPFKVVTNAAVVTEPETVVEGQEAGPFETAKDVPEGGEVKVENLPGGLTVDPATGQVTGTPDKLTDWGEDEESRDVTVKVTITDAEGNEVATGDKVITVQRDTDGDGTPDADDDDDDNDGFTDAEEKEAGTDPKDPDSKPATPADASVVTEPETVVEGQEAGPFETAKDVPEGGEVKVENLPGGLTVDPATGQVTGTPDKLTDWGEDEESRDVTVKVTITDAEGNEVATGDKVITVQRDTDGDGTPDADDDDDDNDGFTDAEEKEAGTDPKDPDSKPSIDSDKTRVDSSGVKPVDPTDESQDTGVKVTNPDDDTKISAKDEDGKDVPVEIDDNGNVAVTPGTDVDGPITVTIEDPDLPDGKVDVEVPVNGHEKDKDDNGSDAQPGDEKTEVDPSGVKPVDPTDESQDTGVKVTNPDDDTKISAKDEDGKDVPVEIDDNGNVAVTPGTDVDGPITVTIEDPDLPDGKVDVEVPVNGHEKDKDDNGSDAQPGDEKTEVDPSDVKPVKPTDEKQDTGVKVTNPDDDTKISAKDEDGKDVPVEIDDNGNVVVTPGTDVDGPITVTIEDPDLPDGKVDVEVPVNGHEKDVDDNGSDAQPGDEKTEVDPSDVKPVKPTDEKQDTGVKVTNPDDDTKISAKDEDGKDVPVEIDDNGNVAVTPGTDVDGPITVTIEDPDLPGGKTEIEVPVEGHEKGVDDNGKTTTASEEDPNYGDPVIVKPGESADSTNPFGEKGAPEGTTITVNTPKDATGWEFTGDENGVITGQAPSNEELAKQFAELGTKDWDKVVEALTPVAEPQVGVDFEYADGSKDTADAKFQLVGKDGKSILDPNGDADGDGVSNKEEAEKGSNPFDKNSTPKDSTPAPTPQGPADPGKCAATAVGFGLPLLALIPIGLATQLSIPGLTDFVENVSMDIERANAQIQKNLGMFNPETAKALSQMNAQLRKAGFDLATVGAGLAVIAAGILAGTLIYKNCAPGDAKSSVKVDSLKGSSGKTWTSSKEDQK